MNRFLSIYFWLASFAAMAQSFAPAPEVPGSTAIHVDSSIIVNWANGVTIVRGPQNIQDQNSPVVSYGSDQDALGVADNYPVSLGDGGQAILTFPYFIENGPGPDFAVFENGFTDNYMELAFVEVSSDGVNYFRFDAISEAPTDNQYWNASFSDCRYVHNLAGKYRVFYGTPFDLDDLSGVPGLDVNMISHVRLIDVVGSIDPMFGSYDSQGTIINDPFPTPFESGGFDLDAVAVINESNVANISNNELSISIFPNPCDDYIYIKTDRVGELQLTSASGRLIHSKSVGCISVLDLSAIPEGVYFVSFTTAKSVFTERLLKR